MTALFDTIEPNFGVLALWRPLPSFSMPHLAWDVLELGGLASHGGEGSSDAQCCAFDSAGFWKIQSTLHCKIVKVGVWDRTFGEREGEQVGAVHHF
jgi:hypothetical protein